MAVAAVNVNVAVAVPVLVPAAVNVVVPHPLTDNAPKLPSPNVGNTSTIVSAAFMGTFSANVTAREVVATVTGIAITRTLYVTAGVGNTILVDTAIEFVVEDISLASASVTPTFREAELLTWANLLVVIPDTIVILHSVLDVKVFDAA